MTINTKYRTDAPEIMDDFALEGEELRDALDKIAKINQLLGGNKLTLNGLKEILNERDKNTSFTIADVGCGNGDMLRKIADFGIKNGYNFKLIGIDANAFTINHAINLSSDYRNINYLCEDIFTMNLAELQCDVIVCTLTLHHFKDSEIMDILSIFKNSSKLGMVINDLQRSAVAYRLFQILCVLFQLNRMSREDGLVSILRGFKKKELIDFSEKLKFKKYNIQWKWAFRYQWIIQNI
ncbi:methyltransferase domain-containing protein [Flavobacterium tegetincola]|uniref:methyltransferase domain-containing protein n=1 Tax=Flavobacterium tegetincola TaxID=150172 RepID=UPI00041AF967|nr:methyltransferase domain-containing protein [Flavobacterium tegetincola]